MPAEKLEKLLVDYRDLRALGIRATREHITRLVRQGRFPRPIRLFGNDQSSRSYWKYRDITAWIEERAEVTKTLPAKRPPKEVTVGPNAESSKTSRLAEGARP
jgi:predicted DNA-binding transcriptional regulator AlpA